MSIYKPTPSDIVTQAFVEHCCDAYQMDHNGYHGFDHWMRVLYNGRLLAGMENANLRSSSCSTCSTTPNDAINEETLHTARERPATHGLSGVFGSTYLTKRWTC
ncbi:hypothetical protein N9I33_00715 [Paracoccaceae bacterium]|nr:hypothetical protein [Paracoccaceae bacterium]